MSGLEAERKSAQLAISRPLFAAISFPLHPPVSISIVLAALKPIHPCVQHVVILIHINLHADLVCVRQ